MLWDNWHVTGDSPIICSISYSFVKKRYPRQVYLEPGTKVHIYNHDNGKTAVEIKSGIYEGVLAYCPTDRIKK